MNFRWFMQKAVGFFMHPYNHHLIFVLLLMTIKSPTTVAASSVKKNAHLNGVVPSLWHLTSQKGAASALHAAAAVKEFPAKSPNLLGHREREQRSEAMLSSQNPQSWNPCWRLWTWLRKYHLAFISDNSWSPCMSSLHGTENNTRTRPLLWGSLYICICTVTSGGIYCERQLHRRRRKTQKKIRWEERPRLWSKT